MTTFKILTLRNLRVWAIVATVAWGGSTVLWGCERFFDPRNDFADGGAAGPYEVRAVAISEYDHPIYAIVGGLDQIEPGQTVGFTSTFCVEKNLYVLARADLIRLRDGARITPGRERLWTPADHRCGTSIAALEVPLDAEEGPYEIRRSAWANPLGWFPQRQILSSVRFTVHESASGAGVRAGTKPGR